MVATSSTTCATPRFSGSSSSQPDLPAAGELLDAVAHSPTSDHRRLFCETTLRSAIGHAHKQLTSGIPRGLRPLGLTDCAAILRTAAVYVEHGGTDTPLQDGSLIPLGPKAHHGWIWRDEHTDDIYGRTLRKLLMERYRLLPTTPDTSGVETLQTGARLLEELLPSLAPSALHHAHVIACAPTAGVFTSSDSSSRPDLGGMFFLRQTLLSNPWRVAEHLLHESIHLKLYDFVVGDILTPSEGRFVERPVIVPWRPSRLCGDNRWHAGRVLAAFHVYVHLALLSTVAERRAPELEASYGPASGMVESDRARARARYLGHQLRAHASCWDRLGPAGQELVGLAAVAARHPRPSPRAGWLHPGPLSVPVPDGNRPAGTDGGRAHGTTTVPAPGADGPGPTGRGQQPGHPARPGCPPATCKTRHGRCAIHRHRTCRQLPRDPAGHQYLLGRRIP